MTTGSLLAHVAAYVVLALGGGIFVYVAGSFALMLAHVDRRPATRHFVEALREVLWAALTQPLVPLFYLVGRRLARGHGVPIVVVHGFTQNRVDFLRIARGLARAGLGPVYGFNYPWFASVHANARRLARFCEAVRRETGAGRVDLVAHSLGGLVALEYLHDEGPAQVRRLITIASPHAGVAWKGPLPLARGAQVRRGSEFLVERATRAVPVPCLSVFSSHDNLVHPPASSMLAGRGARDHAVAHVGHLAILFDPAVVRAVVDFVGAPDAAVVRVAEPSAAGLEPAGQLVGA
ncbi:MAG TPA: alpha/beta fold hydrolase [Polyangiaceae bacterium]|jgi:pimeloyl-ACP methyl ester carboxylesterase